MRGRRHRLIEPDDEDLLEELDLWDAFGLFEDGLEVGGVPEVFVVAFMAVAQTVDRIARRHASMIAYGHILAARERRRSGR